MLMTYLGIVPQLTERLKVKTVQEEAKLQTSDYTADFVFLPARSLS